MAFNDDKIKICRATRTILQFSLLWPPDANEIHPGRWYHIKIIIFMFATSIWCFSVVIHLMASLKNDSNLHVSEDVAFIVVFCGLYYATFLYVKNQQNIAYLLKDLSNFEKYGIPPDFNETEAQLNFWSKLLYGYATIGGIIYNFIRLREKGECEKAVDHKKFNQVCGLLSPFWTPTDISNSPFLYYAIFLYVSICSQMLIKVSLMISFNATEIAHHIILRINYLKIMITDCFTVNRFEDRREKLKKCVSYHSEILQFSTRLDKCFSTGMFTHITMTSAIFACIEKQFVDGDQQLCAAIHFGGWFLTLFVACVGGQRLMSASESIPKAIWFSKWYQAEISLLKSLLLMILRAQRNLKITAGPFGVLSYALFVSVLKMSYSIFCMLTK